MRSLRGAKPNTQEGGEMEILAALAEAYKEKHHAIDPPELI
jgi:HTH-type transcriptional regulator / antitoxin HigA|uniref:Uncharacterized protein n=1 Tax=Marinomonas sp. (strain MWYL1) TaxID=400668 RepID=A6VRB8_MARMS